MRARLRWVVVAAVGLVACLGVGATYLVVRGDDAEFDCADVGIAIDPSGNTPDEALAVYLAERGGDLGNWVLVHQDADSATFEPDNASVSLGFSSIIVAMRPAGVWRAVGGCV